MNNERKKIVLKKETLKSLSQRTVEPGRELSVCGVCQPSCDTSVN